MQYYSQYGHQDFILCLGYKANVVKDYFLNYRQTANSDCMVSNFGKKIEILGERPPDWRVSLVDTGIWRNIGQRLMAVRHLVENEEIFLVNYSDGSTDGCSPDMIDQFKKSGPPPSSPSIPQSVSILPSLTSKAPCGGCVPAKNRHMGQRRVLYLS